MANNSNPVPLASISLSSTQAYVEFTNIPAGFAHLFLEQLTRTNDTSNVVIQPTINSDTATSSYAYHVHQASGTNSTSNYSDFNYAWMGATNGANHSSNSYSVNLVHILNYTKTDRWKSWYWWGGIGSSNTTLPFYFNTAGHWKSTNAITSIKLTPVTGSFVAGSTFNLYGVNNLNTKGTGTGPVTTTP